jgi:hypothetical protein
VKRYASRPRRFPAECPTSAVVRHDDIDSINGQHTRDWVFAAMGIALLVRRLSQGKEHDILGVRQSHHKRAERASEDQRGHISGSATDGFHCNESISTRSIRASAPKVGMAGMICRSMQSAWPWLKRSFLTLDGELDAKIARTDFSVRRASECRRKHGAPSYHAGRQWIDAVKPR